jgi:hypothetical protein
MISMSHAPIFRSSCEICMSIHLHYMCTLVNWDGLRIENMSSYSEQSFDNNFSFLNSQNKKHCGIDDECKLKHVVLSLIILRNLTLDW